MSGSESGGRTSPRPKRPESPLWGGLFILAVVAGLVEPIVGAVRTATTPSVGRWPASALSLLAAAAVALPVIAAMYDLIFKREGSGRPDDPAAMVYRPAFLPVLGLVGTIPTLSGWAGWWATWVYLGLLAVLLAGAVLAQRRQRRVWSWSAALIAGFLIALAALLGAGVVQFIAPHQVRPAVTEGGRS